MVRRKWSPAVQVKYAPQHRTHLVYSARIAQISFLFLICSLSTTDAFTVPYFLHSNIADCSDSCSFQLCSYPLYRIRPFRRDRQSTTHVTLPMYAPPGSGYASSEDYQDIYKSEMPDTYEPMMAFPGTMRPGQTPENMPFQDLPIGDSDPDPVPWPHFQQIEWHHRWSEPPHEHPGTMEDFIESLGRWATPEQEAAMRAGVRRDIRQRQEEAESEKRDTIITDDDDDDDDDDFDDDFEDKEEPVALGDGIYGKLGSDADRAATAAAVAPDTIRRDNNDVDPTADGGIIDDLFVDDDLDDFLLDLGLDSELDDVVVPGGGEDDDVSIGVNILDDDIVGTVGSDVVATGVTPAFSMDDDDEFVDATDMDGDDDEDDVVSTVPLEDFADSDNLDVEDVFDEGGFDYDDGDFGGGDGDIW
jgi:hypothetical protein